ncbi:S15 family peptidase [Streptomyces azureus]|uniref:S15 family peptidase n=1 Tax=Streptomyces azureus TaxID=146537 RepID=A0A0K8PPY4_STRAJ|nr:S15 family peptidase [Streptomyces azureus]
MIGCSYGGAVQLATASVDHRLDALVPVITRNDLAYSLGPNNAVGGSGVPGVFKWQWTNGFYPIGEGQPLLQPSPDPSRINSLACLHFVTQPAGPCPPSTPAATRRPDRRAARLRPPGLPGVLPAPRHDTHPARPGAGRHLRLPPRLGDRPEPLR